MVKVRGNYGRDESRIKRAAGMHDMFRSVSCRARFLKGFSLNKIEKSDHSLRVSQVVWAAAKRTESGVEMPVGFEVCVKKTNAVNNSSVGRGSFWQRGDLRIRNGEVEVGESPAVGSGKGYQ